MPTAGPNSPSAASGWTNSTLVYSSNDSYAVTGRSTSGYSPVLAVTGFGFGVPAGATIDGITVNVEGKASASGVASNYCYISDTYLTKNGTDGVGAAATNTKWTTSDTTRTLGGAADLWGETWTPSEINAATFGVLLKMWFVSPVGTLQCSIDHVAITVTYSTGAAVPVLLHQLRQQGIS